MVKHLEAQTPAIIYKMFSVFRIPITSCPVSDAPFPSTRALHMSGRILASVN